MGASFLQLDVYERAWPWFFGELGWTDGMYCMSGEAEGKCTAVLFTPSAAVRVMPKFVPIFITEFSGATGLAAPSSLIHAISGLAVSLYIFRAIKGSGNGCHRWCPMMTVLNQSLF